MWNAKLIVDSVDLPVAADLENGFGHNPEDAAEAIRQAAAVGLVGGSIEDATGDPARPIYDFDLAVERVAAAAEAAHKLDFPFTFVARAENYLHGWPDLDDTIKRLQAFEKAGADVLFAPGLPNLDAIRTVLSSVTKPLNVVRGGPGPTLAELGAAGVRRVSVGGSLLARGADSALKTAGEELLNTGTFGFGQRHPLDLGAINTLMTGGRPLQRQRLNQPVLERHDAVGAAGQIVIVGGDEAGGALVADQVLRAPRTPGRWSPDRGCRSARRRGSPADDWRRRGRWRRAAARRPTAPPAGAPARGADAEHVEQLAAALVGGGRRLAGDQLRHRDVLERGELGQQMVELVDVADGGAAQQRAAALVELHRSACR